MIVLRNKGCNAAIPGMSLRGVFPEAIPHFGKETASCLAVTFSYKELPAVMVVRPSTSNAIITKRAFSTLGERMTAPEIIKQLVERFDQHRDAHNPQEADRLAREAVDRPIDGLVNESYGLTEEEVKVVGGT
jgi:hypothetical protein